MTDGFISSRAAAAALHRPRRRPMRLAAAAALILSITILGGTTPGQAANITTDANALLEFRNGLRNYDQKLQTWGTPENSTVVCSAWWGVGCTGDASSSSGGARVINITLGGRSLNGPIAANTIGLIDSLQILSLRDNSLDGELPNDLSNCRNLTRITLHNNNLTGSLAAIANLTNFTNLTINNNSFSGPIPDFPSSSSLLHLNVSYNQLNGSIPATIAAVITDPSAFAGNPGLCGPPLAVQCQQSAPPPASAPSGNSSGSTPPTSGRSSDGGLTTGEIAGIVLGSIFFLILLLSCILAIGLARKKSRNGKINQKSRAIPISTTVSSSTSPPGIISSPFDRPRTVKQELVFADEKEARFTIEDLLRASAEVLGKGCLGTTYKATMSDGRAMVVKRLKDLAGEAEEVSEIVQQRLAPLARAADDDAQLLLPITAFFFFPQSEQNLLLVPFVNGGSLYSRLHQGTDNAVIEWEERLLVALEVARAIVYLHHNDVVHGNLKSSNVLLDANGEVLLTDYGLLNIAVYSSPAHVKALHTYLAPEAIINPHRARPPSDTYSFGILLLELLTGKSPGDASIRVDDIENDDNASSSTTSNHSEAPLTYWVNSAINKHENKKTTVFDSRIKTSEHIVHEMEQLLDIALTCVALFPEARPPMDTIVTLIHNIHPPSDLS